METSLKEILARYKGEKGATIRVLQEVQGELGYLPREAINEVGKTLNISSSAIYGVITFYSQFRTTPRGKHIVRVCRGTACHVRGGAQVLDAVERHLNIKDGETTPDLEYTMETVACIGACALAPAMVVDENTYGLMSPGKVNELFSQLESNEGEQNG